MRIDKPTCKYGEQNCRKRFDGNCTVENDFELRCPIERTINEVLEIIDTSQTYKMTAGDPDTYIDKRVLREAVEALKE